MPNAQSMPYVIFILSSLFVTSIINEHSQEQLWQIASVTITIPQLTTNRSSKVRKSFKFPTNELENERQVSWHKYYAHKPDFTASMGLFMERKQIKTLRKRDGMNAVCFGIDITQIYHTDLSTSCSWGCFSSRQNCRSLSRQICSLFHHQDIANTHPFAEKLKSALAVSPLFVKRALTGLKK